MLLYVQVCVKLTIRELQEKVFGRLILSFWCCVVVGSWRVSTVNRPSAKMAELTTTEAG